MISVHVVNARSVCNKAHDLSKYITDNDIDILLVTETWLSTSSDKNNVVIDNLVPTGYRIFHVPHSKGRVEELE